MDLLRSKTPIHTALECVVFTLPCQRSTGNADSAASLRILPGVCLRRSKQLPADPMVPPRPNKKLSQFF